MKTMIDEFTYKSSSIKSILSFKRHNAIEQNHVFSREVASHRVDSKVRFRFLPLLFCSIMILFSACDSNSNSTPANTTTKKTLSSNNGSSITYSTRPQDVLIRTFHGGGKLGTFEISPDLSIYGNGAYILGPGLQMQEGMLQTAALQQLLNTLVDTYSILKFNKQQFYDIPDQNATVLQLMLNGKMYTYVYGPFGNLQESAQEVSEYQRLGKALTSITDSIVGPTRNYTDQKMVLLVHQTFSVDASQTIPEWSFQDFTLFQLATYECGSIPIDETGPNADTGCLTYTVPRTALILKPQQLQQIRVLLPGQKQRIFLEKGFYYSVVLRPLLPDEFEQKSLAMFGSQELNYSGVSLAEGPVPTPQPTP